MNNEIYSPKKIFLNVARRMFKFNTDDFPTIISNDCFGGEIYRSLEIPYNTPFIGLMIMAPCYIKLLVNLKVYLAKELNFTNTSMYAEMNELRLCREYPLAKLGDIEIHFLHYRSVDDARNKWNKRVSRINFENLFLKFDFSKDFATPLYLDTFLKLKYGIKFAVGKFSIILRFGSIEETKSLKEYSTDAVVLFRMSLKYIKYSCLFEDHKLIRQNSLKGFFLSFFLNNSWS